MLICIACTLFKLIHGANFTICSEMFAIGRSTVSKVLRDMVSAINKTMRHKISWPTGNRLRKTQEKFFTLCSLLAVVGAINGMHVSISKSQFTPGDYYYFKSGGYSMNCQAMVDSEKRFVDLYVGMPGSTNDSKMLRRSSLHTQAMHGNLMEATHSINGFTPYLLSGSGYPLLPWLMVPHGGANDLSVSEALFNKKLRRGLCIVENAFGILKQSFQELLEKSDLTITFLPDVVICCAILYNLLLRQSHTEVEDLFQVLQNEGLPAEGTYEDAGAVEGGGGAPIAEDMATAVGTQKRQELGLYLTTRRRHQA